MAIRLLSSESIDGALTLTGNLTGTSATLTGIITANSSVSGDYVRIYGASGTGQWDIYGNGANLRISDNQGAGILAVDRGATFGGTIKIGSGSLTNPSTNADDIVIDNGAGVETGMTFASSVASSIRFGQFVNNSIGSIEYIHTGNHLRFITNGTERVRITGVGNVGIGVSPPADHKLQIHNPGESYARFALTNSNTGSASADGLIFQMETLNSIIKNQEAGYLTFGTSGRETDLRIDSSGKVGIGVDASDYWTNANNLAVGGLGAVSGITIATDGNLTGSLIFADGTGGGDNTRGGLQYNHSTDDMLFRVNNAEKMRITSGGTLKIGGTDAGYSSTLLHTGNYSASQSGINILSSNTGYGYILFGDGDGAASYTGQISYKHGDEFMAFNTDGAERMRISSSGTVTLTGDKTIDTTNTLRLNAGGGILYLDSATNVLIRTNGTTEAMRIDSSADVTIGSSTLTGPRSLTLLSATNATTYDINFQQAGTTNFGRIRFTEGASDFQFFAQVGQDPNLTLQYGGNSFFSRGNVGIGVTIPASKLHVYNSGGGNATDKATMLSQSVMKLQPHASNSTNMLFAQVANGAAMGIQVTNGPATANWDISLSPFGGNVGIGMVQPAAKLDVVGNIATGTRDGGVGYKNQLFQCSKTATGSGVGIDVMFVGHTHALNITVMCIIDGAQAAVGRGYALSSYGYATATLTQTRVSGNMTGVSMIYVNSGGSESYVLRITPTYAGSSNPTIYLSAQGQSNILLRTAV